MQEINPNYKLYVVGSTLSGLGTDNSDVDVCLVPYNSQPPLGEAKYVALERLKFIEKWIIQTGKDKGKSSVKALLLRLL